ncbi:hypothetical protein GUJ93_ZPchr0007g3011 [Zizania palustris]|uniref:Uncharacterized protein n=1 Tax=Zizania palustris TaxID=103762 RepID=A0A8J5TBZ2_ZIZPA|nr:hypothetical protein GUJ93_ZPchr0007g3011 [Zizania palustris]
MGSKWSVIASKLPGRTDNDVKNYWNTKLKKKYLTTTREAAPPPPPTFGDDDVIATAEDSPSQGAAQPAPPTSTPPALVNLDTTSCLDTVDDNDELLLHKSEQLYAELMGLIDQQSATTTTGEAAATTSSWWSSSGTSPTATSDDGSSLWPVDVHDAVPLSESSGGSRSNSSLFFASHAFGASFQDLLGSASLDDVMLAQDLLYL